MKRVFVSDHKGVDCCCYVSTDIN